MTVPFILILAVYSFLSKQQLIFVCLFVLVDGKVKQIDYAATPHKEWVSLNWDLASRPRTFLLFFNPLMLLRGYKDGENTGLLLPKPPSD